jgi:hypothetical protein
VPTDDQVPDGVPTDDQVPDGVPTDDQVHHDCATWGAGSVATIRLIPDTEVTQGRTT